MVMVKSNFCVGVERLPFKPGGYNFWTWRGHRIHYVVQGEGSPIVLIHGFGASAFHWRLVLSLLWTPTVPHSVNPLSDLSDSLQRHVIASIFLGPTLEYVCPCVCEW